MKKTGLLFIQMLCICVFLTACGREEEILLEDPGDRKLLQQEEQEIKKQEARETETEQIEKSPEKVTESNKKEESEKQEIWIDVSGAVKNPGVYQLQGNARVFEAVNAAGGFTEEADTMWLNQAAVVTDGQKLQVYTKAETQEMKDRGLQADIDAVQQEEAGTVQEGKSASNGKINLNTASLAELQEIPGIGEVRAQAILDYREEAGGFQSIQQIQEVPGIKGKTFEKIEEHITVE